VLRAVKTRSGGGQHCQELLTAQRSWESPFEGERSRSGSRSEPIRTGIVYFLQQLTLMLSLYHDYTKRERTVNAYANVGRGGQSWRVIRLRVILDTARAVKAREMSGAE